MIAPAAARQPVSLKAPAEPRRFGWLMPVLGVVGFGLLIYLIVRLGPARIADELMRLGSVLPMVLVVTGAKYCLQTAGWRLVLPPPERPPWGQSLSATITGDALGYVTWAGPFTAEPVRALLIRGSVPVAAGIAAGAIERTMYHVVAALLVLIVLLLVLLSAGHVMGFAAALAVGLVGGGLLAVAGRGRLHAGPGGTGRIARALEPVRTLWRDRRDVLPALTLLELLQHALLVLEAYVLLGALNANPTVRAAFIFEAVTKLVNTAGLLVPARIGVSEGGSALLAGALGFAASYGLSLALMRRIRALIWAAVGLALLPLQEARARRAVH